MNSARWTLEDDTMSVTRWSLAIALAFVVSFGGSVLSAQEGQARAGLGLYGFGPRLGENLDLALELQEELGLSAEQVGSLKNLRAGVSKDVDPLAVEITGLRTMIMAGEVDRVEGLTRIQELLAAYEVVAAPYRTEVETVLTPTQHGILQSVMWEIRPGFGQGQGAFGQGQGSIGLGLPRASGLGLNRGVGLAASGYPGRGVALGLGRSGGRGLGRGVGRGRGHRWWR